jgi:hypothetical protein
MTSREALRFVERHGVVLEAGRGVVPNLAEEIAGGGIRGSWWAHPRANEIFRLTRLVRDSPNVLTLRLVGGKITFVHRRLWPALVRLAPCLGKARLAVVREAHTERGMHRVVLIQFPRWVPASVKSAAKRLTLEAASRQLRIVLSGVKTSSQPRAGTRPHQQQSSNPKPSRRMARHCNE